MEGHVLNILFDWKPELALRFYKYLCTILEKRLATREEILMEEIEEQANAVAASNSNSGSPLSASLGFNLSVSSAMNLNPSASTHSPLLTRNNSNSNNNSPLLKNPKQKITLSGSILSFDNKRTMRTSALLSVPQEQPTQPEQQQQKQQEQQEQ